MCWAAQKNSSGGGYSGHEDDPLVRLYIDELALSQGIVVASVKEIKTTIH